jgi:hypothetical protein
MNVKYAILTSELEEVILSPVEKYPVYISWNCGWARGQIWMWWCRKLNPCHDTRIDRSFSLSDNALLGNGFSSASALPPVEWSVIRKIPLP